MSTNRRTFFATAASGLAWLLGVRAEKPRRWFVNGTGYVAQSAIPQIRDKHPKSSAFAETIRCERVSDTLWNVTVVFSDLSEQIGMSQDDDLFKHIQQGNGKWVRTRDVPAPRVEFKFLTVNEWRAKADA